MKHRIPLFIFLYSFSVSTIIYAGELKDLIPSARELTGFKITKKPEYYNQGNLWDYINGGASGYLSYGFQEMVTFVIMHQKNQIKITADIYDMGDSLNAFGIYSVEREPEGSAEEFGGGSFQSDNILCFWQDKYYVKLTTNEATPKTADSQSLLARILTQKMSRKGKHPHLFTVFPEKGKLDRSERYIARDVFGQDYFTGGYSIEYVQDGNEYLIFLIQGRNTKETKQNFKRYLTFKSTSGQITQKHSKVAEQAFAGTDTFYGTVVFARKGAYIIGALGLDDEKIAMEIIDSMFSRL